MNLPLNTPLPQAAMVGEYVRDIHVNLQALAHDLSPRAEVNSAFGRLVDAARLPVGRRMGQQIMGELGESGVLGNLHQMCASGEYALEKHWAEKIKGAKNIRAALREFPYWNNYLQLAKLEMRILRKHKPDARKVLFVGAGPLPLTAYIMAAHYGMQVTNLDVDADATCCAIEWLEPLMGGHVPCHHIDVRDYTNFSDFDMVMMAALVGLTAREKHEITGHLARHMRPEQLLMVRSVRGLRGLLYPQVKEADLNGFDVVDAVHPRGEVINSVLVARKTA